MILVSRRPDSQYLDLIENPYAPGSKNKPSGKRSSSCVLNLLCPFLLYQLPRHWGYLFYMKRAKFRQVLSSWRLTLAISETVTDIFSLWVWTKGKLENVFIHVSNVINNETNYRTNNRRVFRWTGPDVV